MLWRMRRAWGTPAGLGPAYELLVDGGDGEVTGAGGEESGGRKRNDAQGACRSDPLLLPDNGM